MATFATASPKRKLIIPEVATKVAVAAITNPFEPEPVVSEVSEGGTIGDILKGLGLPAGIPARIFVDDRMVLDRERDFIKPRRGQFVSIRVQAQGGGGGNKGLMMALEVIVVIAAAAATWYVGGAGGWAAAAGLTGGQITAAAVAAGVAVSLVGNLAIHALVPPPTAPNRSFSTSPPSFSVSARQNIAAPLAPIPVILGTAPEAPMLAATPYTHYIGSEQFLRMIFVCGRGPLDINQLKIQDTLIEHYSDVEWEFRAGYPDDAPITLYPGSNFQSAFSLNLSTSNLSSAPTLSSEQFQTSGTNADQLAVVVAAPTFAQFGKGNSSPVAISVTLKIRWAPVGTTSWTNEPNIVINSTAGGQVTKAHTWSVPRGQYTVGVVLTQFVAYKGDWTNPYSADFSWTELDTIRGQAPYAVSGLAMIGLNIRASRQLNGTISNLYAVVSSIMRDYNPTTGLWDDRAGSWTYDYDNTAGGASLYSLDAANALDTTATTGTNFIPNEKIGIADTTTKTFPFTLSAIPVQPGSLIISIGDGNSATSTTGRRHTAAPSALEFITDDGNGAITGPSVTSGSINYTTGVGTITFSTAPITANDPIADYTQIVKTAGAGRALAIKTASGSDGASVAGKSIGVVFHLADYFTGVPVPTNFRISGWYKASSAIGAGIRLRAYFGLTEDPLPGDSGVTHQDIIANGAATTSYQQATAIITAPSDAKWVRVVPYHNPDAVGGVTVYWDRMECVPIGPQISANVNQLPNPSFDFPGRVTSNPASHFRYVCQNNALKLPDSRIDLTTLQTWWQDNNATGRTYNGVLDSPSTVFAVLNAIAAMGRATYAVKNGLHSIVSDKPQTTPIQHFTPRNTWGFRSTKTFPNLPQALKVRYSNPANNYQPDEILVYDDAPSGGLYTASQVTLWESLDLTRTCTDATAAWKMGRYHLAQGRLRPETYEMSCDFENLAATRGDLVLASNDVPEWGSGWARVKDALSMLDGGGNLTGVIVDESSLTFNDGLTYVSRFRLGATGNSLVQVLTNPASGTGSSISTNRLTFGAPIASGGTFPAVGDLVMFGVSGSETAPLLITKITPAKLLSAVLTLVDYAPAVYTADANPPSFTPPGPSPDAFAPVVVSANSSEIYSIRDADGSIQPRIMIQLKPQSLRDTKVGQPIAIEYETRVTAGSELNNRGGYNPATTYNISDMVTLFSIGTLTFNFMCVSNGTVGVTPGSDGTKWTVVDEGTEWSVPARIPPQSQLLIPLVQVGKTYDVELRYIYPKGAFSAWTVLAGHFVAGQVTGPNNVTNLAVVPLTNTGGIEVTFTGSTSPHVKSYSIRVDGDDLAHEKARGLHTRYELNKITPGSHTIYVATYDSSGNSGASPSPSITLTAYGQPLTWSDYSGTIALTALKTFSKFTPAHDIAITRMQIHLDVAPVGNTVNAEIGVSTHGPSIILTGGQDYDFNSGEAYYSAGEVLTLGVTQACVPGAGTAPLGAHIVLTYRIVA